MITLVLMLMAAKPNPYLAQAKVFFQGGDYKQCLKRIEQAQKWDSSLEEQVDVAVYSGLCNFQLRKTKEAEADLGLALKLDPAAKLPPLTSPKAAALFDSLKPKEVQRAEDPAPPPPAKEEPVAAAPVDTPAPEPAVHVDEPPPPARSGFPVAPVIIGGLGVVSVGLAAYFGATARMQDTQSRAAEFQSDAISLRQTASTWALTANLLYAAAGALLITALIIFIATR